MVQLRIKPFQQVEAEREKRERQTALFRRRQAVGLLLLAAAVLLFWLLRGNRGWLFPPGWWRL